MSKMADKKNAVAKETAGSGGAMINRRAVWEGAVMRDGCQCGGRMKARGLK